MREVTDFEISAGIRRELSGRRIDLGKLKFAVLNGVVTFTGDLAFIGLDKTPDETAIEIKFIESTLRSQRGVKELKFEFENWTKNVFGKWESKVTPAMPGAGGGEGFHCPDCHTVFKFCPCCGKPLVAGLPHTGQQRRPVTTGPSLLKPLPRKIEPLKPTPIKPVEPLKPSGPFSQPTPAGTGKEAARPVTPTQLRPLGPAHVPSPPGVQAPIKPLTPVPAPDIGKTSPVMPVLATPKPDAGRLSPLKPAQHPFVPEKLTPVKPVPTPVRPETPVHPVPTAPIELPKTVISRPVPSVTHPEPEFAVPHPVSEKSPVPSAEQELPTLKPAPELPAEPPRIAEAPKPVPPAHPPKPAKPAAPTAPKPNAEDDFFDISMLPPIKPKTPDSRAKQPPPPATASAPKAPPVKPVEPLDETLLPPLKPKAETPPAKPASIPLSETPREEFDDSLLPPLKTKAPETPQTAAQKKTASWPQPALSIDEETPLPPMKPAASIEDDETPLPPMKPVTGAPPAKGGKPQKDTGDPFASLFSEIEAGGGKGTKPATGAKDGVDDLAALDLDIMDIFQKPGAKPAAGPGKPGAPAKPEQPPPDPLNLGGFLDLDAPVEPASKDKSPAKPGEKPKKDPFALDDFDISKFKI